MKARTIGYALTTALSVAAFVGSGLANLFHVEHIAHDMAHLGYPAYFMSILGAWKIAGAVAIAVPRAARLKEWAYAGMLFDLTGAACSRAAAGDGAVAVIVPLFIACIVTTSWALRPDGRRLSATKPGLGVQDASPRAS